MALTCTPNGSLHWQVRPPDVMHAASLAVAMIGQALAQARGLVTKREIKQVDRMLNLLVFSGFLMSIMLPGWFL